MKQRYLIFTNQGARIVKGSKPFGAIDLPKEIPTHIPMKYWKHENGSIIEMSAKEKKKIDKGLKKQKRPQIKAKLTFSQYFQIFTITLLMNLLFYYFKDINIFQKIQELLNN